MKEVDKRLSNTQAELVFLGTYKDKQYPVKALEIMKLQREVLSLNQHSQVHVHVTACCSSQSLKTVFFVTCRPVFCCVFEINRQNSPTFPFCPG